MRVAHNELHHAVGPNQSGVSYTMAQKRQHNY